jgi:hypothetical protein
MSPLSIDETRSLRVSWLTDYTLLAGCYIGVTRSQHDELTIQGEAYIFHRDDSSGRSRNCPVPGALSVDIVFLILILDDDSASCSLLWWICGETP